eukprot:3059139-Alexandrium_andersonii.AAC.1
MGATRQHQGDHRALAALRAPLWDAYAQAWGDWYFYRSLGQVLSQLYYLWLGWGNLHRDATWSMRQRQTRLT